MKIKEKGKDMWQIKLGSEEQKREIIRRKKGLRGRKERTEDNLMTMERKMKWKLENIAREQERQKSWVKKYGEVKN